MAYSWLFNTMRPSDKAREPIQGEFFTADAIDNPGEALVREGIQNSLDARRSEEQVMVRISVGRNESALPRSTLAPYLAGLDKHLKAPGNGLRDVPTDSESCPYLIFEDFGTTGLLGDPAEWNPPSDSRNHFYDFFRADGRSNKGEKDIGRWGVGKQVFPRASRINTIFGLTVRSDDSRRLLMGMAVLRSHNINATRYTPDGLFGRPSAEDTAESLVLPIEDKNFLDSFSDTFNAIRGNEPGLSIVVPWCDLELTDQNLLRAVLRGYFWPILCKQLVVMVEAGSVRTILDASSVERAVQEIGNDLERDILPLIELAKWARSSDRPECVRLSMPNTTKAWQWSKELFPDNCLNNLHSRYERGERLALRIPVTVRVKNESPRESYFDVFLRRDGSEQSGHPVFIREGIIIPDVRAPRTRGVRSIVNAEDGPVGTFLGDSENPAHTQWQKSGGKFKHKYTSGATDLQFIVQSVHKIVTFISEEDKKIDPGLLINYFSIPAPAEEPAINNPENTVVRGPGNETGGPPPPIRSRPRPFIIHRIEGGFIVRNGETNGAPSPKILSIRAAYQVRRGNPFKKYHPADFDFSQHINIIPTGATVLEKKENRLSVELAGAGYQIRVTGFDKNRDVRVEVRGEEEGNAGPNA